MGDNDGMLTLLDVGTGYGRDLEYLFGLEGIRAIGIDNANNFVKVLETLAENGKLPKGSFYKADMRNLSIFSDESFDIVRNHAALVHIPVTPIGVGADEVIGESFRVLKPHGLFYVYAKQGEGLQYSDTGEGLGGRVFQLYTPELLLNLLKKHGFDVFNVEFYKSTRPTGTVNWIAVYASK